MNEFPGDIPEHGRIPSEVVLLGRMDVLVPGEVLDESDVRSVLEEIGAVGMPENVRRDLLPNCYLP